jgi:hypothetical protein
MSCSSTKLISIRGWHVIVGYKLRVQISVWLVYGSHLWIAYIKLNFSYLSYAYGTLEKLKIRRPYGGRIGERESAD